MNPSTSSLLKITMTFYSQGQVDTTKTLHMLVIYNRSISLPDFKGYLIGMIFHKGCSTFSGHCTSMISVNKIWYLCNDSISMLQLLILISFTFRVYFTYSFAKDKYSEE